jgi:hypothetical protein
MTEAELTIEEIKVEMEKCKDLFNEVGDLMDGHSVGVGTIVLAKSIATVACMGGVPKDDLLDLVARAYDDIDDGLKEEGLSKFH